jgi:hypothetical protein
MPCSPLARESWRPARSPASVSFAKPEVQNLGFTPIGDEDIRRLDITKLAAFSGRRLANQHALRPMP